MMIDLLHLNKIDSTIALQLIDRSSGAVQANRPLPAPVTLEWLVVIPRALARRFETIEFDVINPCPKLLQNRSRDAAEVLLRPL
jgi:hypothetical protein